MGKYNVKINGKSYEVEVETIGGLANTRARRGVAPARSNAAPVLSAVPIASAPEVPVASAVVKEPVDSVPASKKPSSEKGTPIESGISGKVFKIIASAGQNVSAGQEVIILEAMKMEIPIVSPVNGIVGSINVNVGDLVDAGQILGNII